MTQEFILRKLKGLWISIFLKSKAWLYPTNIFDHSKSADVLKNMGIPVFKPYEEYERNVKFGGFNILPFELVHDVTCYGFLIQHRDMGTTIYITDTEYCKWIFKNVNHIICECNYDKRQLDDNNPARNHILTGHMELQTTLEFVRTNKSNALRNVILCHLSQNNSNARYFINEMQKVTGRNVNVDCAVPGLVVEVNKDPF